MLCLPVLKNVTSMKNSTQDGDKLPKVNVCYTDSNTCNCLSHNLHLSSLCHLLNPRFPFSWDAVIIHMAYNLILTGCVQTSTHVTVRVPGSHPSQNAEGRLATNRDMQQTPGLPPVYWLSCQMTEELRRLSDKRMKKVTGCRSWDIVPN